MIVVTLPVFYYEKLVGYMPSSFADLVFAGERIKVGLKRGKFDYVAPVSTSNRRSRPTGAKRKELDAHAMTLAPVWPKPQPTHHNTHRYAQHHPSISPRARNLSNSMPVQQRTSAPPLSHPANVCMHYPIPLSLCCHHSPMTPPNQPDQLHKIIMSIQIQT